MQCIMQYLVDDELVKGHGVRHDKVLFDIDDLVRGSGAQRGHLQPWIDGRGCHRTSALGGQPHLLAALVQKLLDREALGHLDLVRVRVTATVRVGVGVGVGAGVRVRARSATVLRLPFLPLLSPPGSWYE
eukprot:scaffold24034_cov57-Phaeocystis_antarctica.AAC.4